MADKKRHSRKQASRRSPTTALIILCALLTLVCGIFIYKYYSERARTLDTEKRVMSLYAPTDTATADEATAEEASVSEATVPEITDITEIVPDENTLVIHYPVKPAVVDEAFTELYSANPDTVGFISIPSHTTPIDLVVVQRDNEFYLDHDFFGEKDKAGTLFLDRANEIWPQDQHMIIYGHNMKNGTMFARLTKYKSIEYASVNPFVYFDTIYEKGAYVVLAAIQLPAKETLTEQFNIRTFIFGDTSFNSFIYEIGKRALYYTGVGVESGDKLLSLITCSYSDDDERFILITRRIRDDETESALKKRIKH